MAKQETINLKAKDFIAELKSKQSSKELEKIQRYFKSGKGEYGEGDQFIGIRMLDVFDLAKKYIGLPLNEVEKLMESPIHEVRAGAMSILDKKARLKQTNIVEQKEMFELYLRRHDRINNWDLVDLAAQHVLGKYLNDKPKTILSKLAKSKNIWERRSAIVSTAYFLKSGNIVETFKIAELLVNDQEDLIQKAVGGWIRQAGKSNELALLDFLDKNASNMPRTMLRTAMEHLDKKKKAKYLLKLK